MTANEVVHHSPSNSLGVTGIIFNLLEEAVTRRFGPGAWAEMLAKVDVGGFLPFDKYPDDEFFRLLGALPVAPEMSVEERLRWFGRAAVPLLAERYPLIFAPHSSAESFLLTLNAILHPGGSMPADVESGPLDLEVLEVEPPGGLVLGYRSARRLCALAEGFVTGTADYYGEHVQIQQPRCMHHGEERCALVCTFAPAA
ncbi:MAG TPA: heme NO-binding domain-containing protein [Acidimicrobiia bacterium]|nr:heme NO-binding domain-containing protein [Acidimicrobiia bacterium]